ncbi:helix-turn-helix domain-containing protein [Citrobacter sp. Cpo100]|uniref:hypothetical protein n=1 Tax=Citrobacter sp. Cpo100 TaxID=2985141 RepID=UPI00257588BD|nr:hypothetical protein [Citrobacter sp. Cpo100]MDM2823170.1 helix-turn-helix domain-containing protein [Citrobacter sp. Cpo100]
MNINKLIVDTVTYGNRAFNLNSNEIMYIIIILSFAKEHNEDPEFWPSRDNIKGRSGGMSRDTQLRTEKKLTEKGLFLGKSRHQIGMKCPNNYFLALELMQERYRTFEAVELQEQQAEEVEQVATQAIAPISEEPPEAPHDDLTATPIPEQPQVENVAQTAIQDVRRDTQICVTPDTGKPVTLPTEIPVANKTEQFIEDYRRKYNREPHPSVISCFLNDKLEDFI